MGSSLKATQAPSSASGVRRRRRASLRPGRPIMWASIVIALGVWQGLSVLLGQSSTGFKVLPGIDDTLGAFISFAGYWGGGLGAESTRTGAPPTYWGAVLGFAQNGAVSVLRVTAGYLLGVIVGLGVAFTISYSTIARKLFEFPAHFARMLPLLAMLPLFGLWFGNSEIGSLVFVSFAVAILVFVMALNAVENVPVQYSQFARSLGAGRLRTYVGTTVPAAFPQIRSPLLLAVAFSWSALLAAEMLGKQSGLGYILNSALQYAATDTIALTGLVVVAVSAATYALAAKALTYLTRWAE